jgi:transcriptional regulator with XRE-family HTH domain
LHYPNFLCIDRNSVAKNNKFDLFVIYLQHQFKREARMKSTNNLKAFREASGFTQERVASFLSIERGALANYELGTRETPLPVLMKLSDLYGVDIADFYETDPEKVKDALLCSFRMDNLSDGDLEEISSFKEVVKSYLKMTYIEQG